MELIDDNGKIVPITILTGFLGAEDIVDISMGGPFFAWFQLAPIRFNIMGIAEQSLMLTSVVVVYCLSMSAQTNQFLPESQSNQFGLILSLYFPAQEQ